MAQTVFKKLLGNASVLLTGQVAASIMGLLSIMLAARTLGAKTLGEFAMIQAYAIIVDRLMNFQCWQAVVKFGAVLNKEKKHQQLQSLVKFCTILDVATAFLGAVIAVLGILLVAKLKGWNGSIVVAGLVYSGWILFNVYGSADGVLRLFGGFKFISAIRVIAAALKLVMVFVGYLCSVGLIGIVVIWVVTGVVESGLFVAAGWWQLRKGTGAGFIGAKVGDSVKDKSLWSFVLSTNFEQSVRLASRELDVLIIGAILGAAATGIYKIAKQFANISIRLVEPIFQALYPEFSHLVADKCFSEIKRLAIKVSAIGGGITLSVLIVFMVAGKWILSITAGDEFVGAQSVAVAIMSARVLWGFACPLPSALLAMGRAQLMLVVQIFSLAVFLPSLYFLSMNVGLLGAGLAQVVFFVVYSLMIFVFFVRTLSRQSRV